MRVHASRGHIEAEAEVSSRVQRRSLGEPGPLAWSAGLRTALTLELDNAQHLATPDSRVPLEQLVEKVASLNATQDSLRFGTQKLGTLCEKKRSKRDV